MSPDGKTLYVTGNKDMKTGQDTSLVQVDLATGTVGHAISFGSGIEAIAVAPDGDVYVYDQAGLFSVSPHAQHFIRQIGLSWAYGGAIAARYLALTPDGQTAYVSADDGGGFDNMVIPIDLRTHQAEHPVRFSNGVVTAIAASPDSKMLYVGLDTGVLYPIDVATNMVGRAVDLPEGIQSLVIGP